MTGAEGARGGWRVWFCGALRVIARSRQGPTWTGIGFGVPLGGLGLTVRP